jgi:hypothetical protein
MNYLVLLPEVGEVEQLAGFSEVPRLLVALVVHEVWR